jgi:hypothetical protein
MTTHPVPISVAVYPGASSTLKCEISISENAYSDPANAHWFTWAKDVVGVDTIDVLTGPVTAIRFTRMSGSTTGYADIATN